MMGLQVREFIFELCTVMSKIDDMVVGTLLYCNYISLSWGMVSLLSKTYLLQDADEL
jgi:hypothetical protein